MPSAWQDHNQETQDVLTRLENRVYKVFSLVGVALAVVMSWQYNHSVLWAAFHGCLGWLYVFYAWIFK
jgi:hypothetical protein